MRRRSNEYRKRVRLEHLYDKLAAGGLSRAEHAEALALCEYLGLDHDWMVFNREFLAAKEDPWREPPARPVRTSKKIHHT